MTLFQLYLLTVILPNAASVIAGLDAVVWISVAILIVALIPAFVEESEKMKKILARLIKIGIIWGASLAMATVVLPTQQQLYTLAGGYVATNAKNVKKLPDNVVAAANAWLEKAAGLAKESKDKK